jgi:hypothetical protein
VKIFDKNTAFVLDISRVTPIIYIWYEGGELNAIPCEGKRRLKLDLALHPVDAGGRCPEAQSAGLR